MGNENSPPARKEEEMSQDVCILTASGGEEIVHGDSWHEIQSRFRLKEPEKAIARTMGVSVQTLRQILLFSHCQEELVFTPIEAIIDR